MRTSVAFPLVPLKDLKLRLLISPYVRRRASVAVNEPDNIGHAMSDLKARQPSPGNHQGTLDAQ